MQNQDPFQNQNQSFSPTQDDPNQVFNDDLSPKYEPQFDLNQSQTQDPFAVQPTAFDPNQVQQQNDQSPADTQDFNNPGSFVPPTDQSLSSSSEPVSAQPSQQTINWDEIFAQLNDASPQSVSQEAENHVVTSDFSPTIDGDGGSAEIKPEINDYVNSYDPSNLNSSTQDVQPVQYQPQDQAFDQALSQTSTGAVYPENSQNDEFSDMNSPMNFQEDVVAETDSASQDQVFGDESLEAQNIFELLGVNDGSDDEKEKFLDELQQVIWEDFLEKDVELLVTSEEKQKVDEILAKQDLSELEKQEQLVVYLEKLIPDLEEIMLEKALDLKRDLFKERIAGFKEYYAGNEQSLAEVNRAESLINQDKWKSASQAMNSIK